MRHRILITLLLLAGLLTAQAQTATNIRNDVFWQCTDGTPIYSQGGGIFRFADPQSGQMRYYWYGVHYKEAETYRKNPSVTYERNSFESVTCYVSDDLVNWAPCGDALTREEVASHTFTYWVGRLGVAKVDDVYALFVQCGSQVLVVESPTPTGPFRWGRLIDMTDMIGTSNTGDQTVFTDEDTGKSYLVCSKGKGRNHIYVAEIGRLADGTIGLLDCTEVFAGAGREGNCMFKHAGKYYLCASNLYGWDCSYAYFLVADNPKGPYRAVMADYRRPVNDYPAKVQNDMQVMPGCESDYAHITQTGFFYTLRSANAELVVYCGDRWADFAGNGLGYNQWVPLSFEGDTPHFNSVSSWHLDATNATWSVAEDNDYAMNGSFEADRRIIPLKEKPRQDFITGWKTEYIAGKAATVDDDTSPRLNYEKTRAERQGAIGEKALLITDRQPFRRRVSQQIQSTPTIPLPDGTYTLEAKAKRSGDFAELYIYATSDGRTEKAHVKPSDDDEWQTVSLRGVKVRSGRATIGIYADGQTDARCLIDDVTFVRERK